MNLIQLMRPRYYFLFQPGLGYYTYKYNPDAIKCGRTVMYLHTQINQDVLLKAEKDFTLALQWHKELSKRDFCQLIEVSLDEKGGYIIKEVNTNGA